MQSYEEKVERKKKIHKMREDGITFHDIGIFFGITRTRAWQIFHLKKVKKSIPLNPFWEGKPEWQREGRERVREMVRARDDYKCQVCGKKWKEGQRRLDVHHLNGLCGKKSRGYDSKDDMGGLVTLCHKCHYNHPEHTFKIKG